MLVKIAFIIGETLCVKHNKESFCAYGDKDEVSTVRSDRSFKSADKEKRFLQGEDAW